jgi:hypothetical protein
MSTARKEYVQFLTIGIYELGLSYVPAEESDAIAELTALFKSSGGNPHNNTRINAIMKVHSIWGEEVEGEVVLDDREDKTRFTRFAMPHGCTIKETIVRFINEYD